MSISRPRFLHRAAWAVATWLLLVGSLAAQPFVDPCFSSPATGPSFAGTANVTNNNADLLSWTGAAWTGGWPGANITLAPPGGVVGTRAIWSGDGTVWTTGGEGFGLRLSTPIVTGTTYTFSFRRVSHGTGQNGTFAPILYTNTTGTFGTSYGAISGVGTAWANPNITFTATAGSSGHTFVYFHNNVGSGLFMGCTVAILPMAFSALQAFQLGESVQLSWQVQHEESYLWHVVERSQDGFAFTEVGRIPSVQTAEEAHLYEHADDLNGLHAQGALYYRIRSIDVEGKDALSPVVMTRLGHASAFEAKLSPNPAANGSTTTMEFYASESGTAQYRLCELSGRCIRAGEWNLNAGNNRQTITLEGLAPGMYLIDVRAAGKRAHATLLVQ